MRQHISAGFAVHLQLINYMDTNTILLPGSQPVLRGVLRELFRLELPHTDAILSPNGNAPLSKRGAQGAAWNRVRVKGAAKRIAAVEAKRAGVGRCSHRPDAYRIIWFFSGRAPDLDNLPSRCKAYLDAVCAALGMDDGGICHMEVLRVHDAGMAGRVVLVFGQWVSYECCAGCCREAEGRPDPENLACEVCARGELADLYEGEVLS